ncbi:survival of motor neuron-related-splicing factor 30-like [Diadema antillarum]|uniref:survival of motor neuron-related-splicing factor 30-like n=1 Tax=Diadema antillarum TaxID=105358 RepID=UPI003A8AA4B6
MATSSDDYSVNLATYKAQLQQVEAALTNDAENEELLKLKQDLQEVIDLTTDLLKAAQGTTASAESDSEEPAVSHSWNVADRCLACWSKDQQYYPATIDQVHEDGTVTVIFDVYENIELKHVSKLKDIPEDQREKRPAPDGDSDNRSMSKKQMLAKQREYKKKKQQKKADRLKQQEQLHEDQKKSWQNFSSKALKGKKGFTKKSIFASPDFNEGKVGVGTCGVGGQPMTKFKMPKHKVVRK